MTLITQIRSINVNVVYMRKGIIGTCITACALLVALQRQHAVKLNMHITSEQPKEMFPLLVSKDLLIKEYLEAGRQCLSLHTEVDEMSPAAEMGLTQCQYSFKNNIITCSQTNCL